MKKTVLTLGVLLMSVTSFAGPNERAAIAEAKDSIAKGTEAYKKACGCPVKINVNWGQYTAPGAKVDEIRQIRNVGESFISEPATKCTDADTKAVMCKMKTVELAQGASNEIKVKGGTVSVTVAKDSYFDFTRIAREFDK